MMPVRRLHVVGDQANHHCVIRKLHNSVGAVCGCIIMGVQGVKQGAQDAALGALVLRVRVLEVQLPIFTLCGLPNIPELGGESEGNYSVKCRAEINEQQMCIVPLADVQVGGGGREDM